jgi:DNA-directed RNA polymerase sigma subunit (sigma70/sigma32)
VMNKSGNLCAIVTDGLDEREEYILEHRIFGQRKLYEIAERFSVSTESIRQIERKVKAKLIHAYIRSRNEVQMEDGEVLSLRLYH